MNSQTKVWTSEECNEALRTFFESDEAERFREIFSRECTEEDLAVFRRDADRRSLAADEATSRWWQSLQALVKDDPASRLALAESLAQHGLAVEELHENLPDAFEPPALLQAIARATGSPGGLAASISNTEGWTDEQIRKRLEEVRARLDWEGSPENAQMWWTVFEAENQARPAIVLRLAEELAVRKGTITEFHDAYLHSGTENIEANLHFLDYARLKAVQPKAAKRKRLTCEDSGWWLKPVQGMTKVRGWTDERIRGRIEEAKAKLDWESAPKTARTWWEAFEKVNAHRLALVFRLAEELAGRKATIAAFHEAFGLSTVNDVQANLYYLDYKRLKEEEERKKKAEEERKHREEEREKNREERVATASRRFRELLPLLAADAPAPGLTPEDTAILLNLPREDVPESVRERFEQAIGSFGYETVRLDETGQVTERRQLRASRQVEELIPGVALEMVEVPGGTFPMGSEEYKDELPIRNVNVPTFFIGKFTITQEQWAVVAGWEKVERDLDPDPARFKGDDRPVETISWEEAKEFCARLSRKTGHEYRLPTEAEWEYASRAGTATPFAFGETITPEIVNYNGEYPYAKAEKGENRGETVSVGSLGVANPFGLFDMHGNVWEWCEDDWHDNYDGAPTDGRAWISDSSRRAPHRVDRGGGWNVGAASCRSANRYRGAPGDRYGGLGFRLVRTYP